MEQIIIDHLNFEHKGKEGQLKDVCILCKNFLDNQGDVAPDLGVNLSDSATTKDIFGSLR
jgi:hypothetical protein